MHFEFDEKFKGIVCDCSNAEECFQMIIDIGFDYDGMDTSVDSMRELVDELCDLARRGIGFILEKKYTPEETKEEDRISEELALEKKKMAENNKN